MSSLRSIHDLSTEEAYWLVHAHIGGDLPPQDAIENEDWGRDYILQLLLGLPTSELERLGLTWSESE